MPAALLVIATLAGLVLAACATPAPRDDTNGTWAVALTVSPSPQATAVVPSPSTTAVPPSPSPQATSSPSPAPTATPRTYVVAPGDTLENIAERFDTTAAQIQDANGITDPNLILLGSELVIPAREVPAGPAGNPTAAVTEAESTIATATQDAVVTATAPVAPTAVATVPGEIARSYLGLPIQEFVFGSGPRHVILVGGIHGGYEWNTILLAYEMLDLFQAQPELIPEALTVHLIPNANPDGLWKVSSKTGRFTADDLAAETFAGRTNGNNVDLNRNWDCAWTADGTWRNQPISGGAAPFSEPETAALRDYIVNLAPAAVLFWHSAANGVYAASCPEVFQPTLELANVYGTAAGYPVYERFQYYEVTGDAGDYLSTIGIPSISVELTTHESLDWEKNRAGTLALLEYLAAL